MLRPLGWRWRRARSASSLRCCVNGPFGRPRFFVPSGRGGPVKGAAGGLSSARIDGGGAGIDGGGAGIDAREGGGAATGALGRAGGTVRCAGSALDAIFAGGDEGRLGAGGGAALFAESGGEGILEGGDEGTLADGGDEGIFADGGDEGIFADGGDDRLGSIFALIFLLDEGALDAAEGRAFAALAEAFLTFFFAPRSLALVLAMSGPHPRPPPSSIERAMASSIIFWCSFGSAQRARPSGGSRSIGSKYT